MRTYPRRYSQRAVPANTDQALWGYPLVPGGILNRLHFNTHVLGPEESLARDAFLYGFGVWVVTIQDLDQTADLDALWDIKVPKDEAETEGGFNLNLVGENAEPEFGAGGEIDLHSIFEIKEGSPQEIYRRRTMMTAAKGAISYTRLDAAADVYTPGDQFKGLSQKRTRVRNASMVIAGFSSPSLDQTMAPTADVVPTEKQWVQLKFLDQTLRQALMSAIGLIASGTQEPFTEALAWISKYLEQDIVQDTASAFQTGAYDVFSMASADITIPSSDIGGHLSSE